MENLLHPSDVIRAGFAGLVGFIIANYVQQLLFSEALVVGGVCAVSYLGAEYLYSMVGGSFISPPQA